MCKILVVDDESAVRAAVKRRLSRDGYKVEEAESEAEAAEAIQQAEPAFDVVVTDMVMDGEDSGVRVLKAALQKDIFTEVMILTAYGNVANAVECMKLGAYDYVEKNIPGVDVFDLLAMKVEQAMQRRRSSVNTVRRANQIMRSLSANE